MAINQRKAGVMLTYLGEAIKILTGLIYTPVMLRLLGQSEYGLYQLVYSVVSYLSLLSLGFGSAYMRFYSRYKVQDDEEGIARLNGMFLTIFSTMSAICILCGSVMVMNARTIFGDGLTADELSKARVLMALMVANLALTFPNSVFNCYVTAHERFLFQKLLLVLQNLLSPFLTLPLLLMGHGSVAVVVIQTALTFGVFACNVYYCSKKLKICFVFRGFRFSHLKEMTAFTIFIFLNQIIDQLNWNVDKFLLGRLCGTVAVAMYGVAGQLNSMYLSLLSVIPAVYVPMINRIVVKNEPHMDEQLSKVMCEVGRVVFMIALYIYVGFVCCGRIFIQVWAGAEYANAYIVALLLITPLVVSLPHGVGIEIRRAKNLHQWPAAIMLITAVLNTIVSIPLIVQWGPIGAALGTFFSVMVNQTVIDIYYVKIIHIDVRLLLRNMRSILVSCAIPIAVGLVGLMWDSLWLCVLWAALYSVLYFVFLYRFGMTEREREQIRNVADKVIRGKK